MTLSRRSFFLGLSSTLLCAPAIVRASSLMAVKPVAEYLPPNPLTAGTLLLPEEWTPYAKGRLLIIATPAAPIKVSMQWEPWKRAS